MDYLQRLPTELLIELALRLSMAQLLDIHPVFSRFSDPNHSLWKQLCRRDLLVTPSSEVKTYHQQCVEAYSLTQTMSRCRLAREYVKRGYHRALRHLKLKIRSGTLSSLLITAAECGQVFIMRELLVDHVNHLPKVITKACTAAAANGHTEALLILLELAIIHKQIQPPDFYLIVLRAVRGNHLQLIQALVERGPMLTKAQLDDVLYRAALWSPPDSYAMVESVLKWYTPTMRIPYHSALEAALIRGHLGCADYLIERSGRTKLRRGLIISVVSSEDPGVHRWLIAHTDIKVYTKSQHDILNLTSNQMMCMHLNHRPLDGSQLLPLLLRFRGFPDVERLTVLTQHPNVKLHRVDVEAILEAIDTSYNYKRGSPALVRGHDYFLMLLDRGKWDVSGWFMGM